MHVLVLVLVVVFVVVPPQADSPAAAYLAVPLEDNSPDPAHQVTKTFSLNPKSITMEDRCHALMAGRGPGG